MDEFKIVDKDYVLWEVTLVQADSGEISTHYFVAERDCVDIQDVLDISQHDAQFLADLVSRPNFTNHDILLLGVCQRGLVNIVRKIDAGRTKT